jgi:hypothetical protein
MGKEAESKKQNRQKALARKSIAVKQMKAVTGHQPKELTETINTLEGLKERR